MKPVDKRIEKPIEVNPDPIGKLADKLDQAQLEADARRNEKRRSDSVQELAELAIDKS